MPVQNSTFASALGGGLTVIAAWALSTFGHIVIPPEVSAAFTGIVMAGITHWVPDSPPSPPKA